MNKQLTQTILMVPPHGFCFNEETAITNRFQSRETHIGMKALEEFNNMVSILRKKGVQVLLLTQEETLPDAVFPNNWFSTHVECDERYLVLYPMLTPNRQLEVQKENLITLLQHNDIHFDRVIDLRSGAQGPLESTGSLVLDRQNKIAYAALSSRTNKKMVYEFANHLHYHPFTFNVIEAVYHTNIMMSIADQFAVVCLEAIAEKKKKLELIERLSSTKHEIIEISYRQLCHMCGNILAVKNQQGKKLLLMSQQAYDCFRPDQLETLSEQGQITPISIPSIEKVGGGSVRCMIAEIF